MGYFSISSANWWSFSSMLDLQRCPLSVLPFWAFFLKFLKLFRWLPGNFWKKNFPTTFRGFHSNPGVLDQSPGISSDDSDREARRGPTWNSGIEKQTCISILHTVDESVVWLPPPIPSPPFLPQLMYIIYSGFVCEFLLRTLSILSSRPCSCPPASCSSPSIHGLAISYSFYHYFTADCEWSPPAACLFASKDLICGIESKYIQERIRQRLFNDGAGSLSTPECRQAWEHSI